MLNQAHLFVILHVTILSKARLAFLASYEWVIVRLSPILAWSILHLLDPSVPSRWFDPVQQRHATKARLQTRFKLTFPED